MKMGKPRILTTNDIIEKIKKGEKNFSKSKIIAADFSGMDLTNANFESSELEWIRFADCKLIGTNFTGAKIDLSYFSYADLTKANFEKAKVYNSYFGNVTFDKTSFKNADIRYVLFVGTNLGAADFNGATKLTVLTSFTQLTQNSLTFKRGRIKQGAHRKRTTLNGLLPLLALLKVTGWVRPKMGKFLDAYE